MQHSRAFILLALLVCLFQQVASLAIDVRANTQECFFEELDVGDKMTVTFQVRQLHDWMQSVLHRVDAVTAISLLCICKADPFVLIYVR